MKNCHIFLTTRQKTKKRNAFSQNTVMETKLSKAQLTKTIQFRRYIARILSELGKFGKLFGKKAVTDIALPVSKGVFPAIVNNVALNPVLNAINQPEREITGKGAAKVAQFTFY